MAFGLWLAALFFPFATPAEAEGAKTTYSRVELVAEQATLPASGGEVSVGFYIEPDPGWHVYWRNPGDAGLPATMQWLLPDGFSVSAFEFPAPHVIPFGDLVTYGFDEPVLLLGEVSVPAGLSPGTEMVLSGDARWVVCDDELCVPEKGSLSLALAVGDGADNPGLASRFAAARAKLPEPVDWPAHFEVENGTVRVTVETPEPAANWLNPYLFVAQADLVEYAGQTATGDQQRLLFSMDAGKGAETAAEFPAVMTFADSADAARAIQLGVRRSSSGADWLAQPVASAGPPSGEMARATGLSLATALLFAFVGGVLLNLMPCVFPVLSIKALSLISTAHANQRLARLSGLLYTAGILVAFTLIGVGLVSLRSAGQAVGWGFQLQSPIVNLGLALLMLAIALNLFGVYEFGTRAAGIGQSLTGGDERKSAFFTGLLAVVVATPCTAPFMAGALGYALMQPTIVALGIFIALGLGLASPYLLVGFIPAFGRMLPRPGAWMGRFRNMLAFPMFATALWLLWVLGKQLGVNAMAVGLLTTLLFAFSLWSYGQVYGSRRPWAWACLAGAALIATLATAASIERYRAEPGALAALPAKTLGQLEPERFTPERLASYVGNGQRTFVYFTADWCVNCKLNERVALASDAVGRAFRERGIKVLVGDWTNEDPVISEWLNRYGRAGVPLYLYFPAGATLSDARVLPQVLLPDIVVDAIKQADGGTDR